MPIDNDATDSPDSPQISEAARWAARRIDRTRWTAQDEGEFRTWLDACPEHRDEMAELEATLDLMDRPEAFAPGEVQRVLRSQTAREESRRRPSIRRSWLAGLAAAAAVLFCVSWWLYFGTTQVISTGIAERRDAVLRDGTRVQLDADTTLKARIAWRQRTIEVLSGEVVFDVAPDERRPFAVRAGGCEIRDIGTIFSVHLLATDASPLSGVEVAVQEGAVEIRSTAPERTDVLRLAANESATWTGGSETPQAEKFKSKHFASWREGRRYYVGDPLQQIVADLQRYSPERLELRDASLAGMTVTGTLSMDQPGEALEVLRAILPLRVIREPDRIILAQEAGDLATPPQLVP